MDNYLGKEVSVSLDIGRSGKLRVRCRVLNTRSAYGRTDLLVTPIAGSGEIWVDSRRVSGDSGV